MPDLKLLALDADDLAVLSAHLQDAVLRVGDAAYLKSERRFALVANRFDWLAAVQTEGKRQPAQERRRCGLRFERVLGAQVQNLDLKSKDAVLELLAVSWAPTGEGPDGHVLLHFAGGGNIRLAVECLEAELRDLGAAWTAKSRPHHPEPASNPAPAQTAAAPTAVGPTTGPTAAGPKKNGA